MSYDTSDMERHYKQDSHNLFDHAGMEDIAAEVRNAHSITNPSVSRHNGRA